jgi:hypothetical protein
VNQEEDFDITAGLSEDPEPALAPAQAFDAVTELERVDAIRAKLPSFRDAERVKRKKTLVKEEKERRKEAAEKQAANQWDSTVVLNKDEAHELIRSIWSRDRNVIDQTYIYGSEIAPFLGLVTNTHFWSVGAHAALQSREAGHNVEVPDLTGPWNKRAEVLTKRELYYLWSMSNTGRQILKATRTFDEWLEQVRDRCRKDWMFLGKPILKVPFDDIVHQEFADFYSHLFDDVTYPDDYTLQYENDLVAACVNSFEGLLLFPRGYLKSAGASVFALQFLLNFNSSAVFTLSGTDTLAQGFMRIQRGYLSKMAESDPTDFHLIFPEYTMHNLNVQGETPITLPCRRFDNKDFSFRVQGITGQISSVHSGLLILDDAVQDAGTAESREKLKNLLDTIASNIPNAGSAKAFLGTRYDKDDYYSGLIAISYEDPAAIRLVCRPAVTKKEGLEAIPWKDLEFDQVNLLWANKIKSNPEKTWDDLKKKAKRNLNDFLCQQLNDPPAENMDNRTCFDSDLVHAHVKSPDLFPRNGYNYLVVDVAYSTDMRADFSVIACGMEALNDANPGEQSLYFTEIDAKRRSNAQLAVDVAEAIGKFHPVKVCLEKVNGVELLCTEIQRQCNRRGYNCPEIAPIPVNLTKGAKFSRIKNSEIFMRNDRIFISDKCTSLTLMFDQYLRLDGKTSTQVRKDDIPDCVALLADVLLEPVNMTAEQSEARKKLEQETREARMRAQHYEMMFGSGNTGYTRGNPNAATPDDFGPQSAQQRNPIHAQLEKGGRTNEIGKKMMGFKDAPIVSPVPRKNS